MKNSDLLKVVSSSTLSKLKKGETVRTDTLEKICALLGCQPGDIMEVVEIDKDEATDRAYLLNDELVDYTHKIG